MSGTPKISVIMPVFNGAKYLRHALGSISSQALCSGDLEIIVAEDGSADDSPGILREASASLPITVIDGARQGNWVASTNRALQKASGDYVCFLHQDDVFMSTRLKTLMDVAAAFPDAQVFAHPVRFIDGAGKSCGTWTFPSKRMRHRAIDGFSEPTRVGHYKMPLDRRLPPSDWFPQLLVQNNLAVPGVMFRRTLLDSVGFLDESLRYTADWDFWLRLAAKQDLVLLPEPLAEYRIHREAQTVGFAEKQTEYAENLRIVLDRYIGTLDALPEIDRREAEDFRAMATLGVKTNLWLASRITAKPQPTATLLRALRTAGIRSSIRYLRLSRIVPRVVARLRANVNTRSSPREPQP